MVIKRPMTGLSEPEQVGEGFNEQLVKKSLTINPKLRQDGQSTHEVMDDLRQQAIARSKSAAQTEPEAKTTTPDKASQAERRKGAISFFIEQKAVEFDESAADIAARERRLKDERQALQGRYVDELVVFLGMMSGAANSPEVREVLAQFRPFLTKLGINEADLLRTLGKRK